MILTEAQKEVLGHALLVEYEKVRRAGGNQYGPLNLEEIKELFRFLCPETERTLKEYDPIFC